MTGFKFPKPPGFTAPISKDLPPETPDLSTTAPDIEVETIEIAAISEESQHEALPEIDWDADKAPEVPQGVEYPANGVQDKKRRGGRRSMHSMTIAGTGISIHPRDKALVEAYIATGFNGGIAYQTISPDVCERTALAQASLILKRPEVQEFLAYRMEQLVTETGLDVRQKRILKEFERLAYAGISDVIGWDAEGNVTVIASTGLSEDVLKGIKKVKVNSTDTAGIKRSTIEIEMHDKKSSLDSLAKIHGMIIDRKEISGPEGAPITLAAAIAEIEDANTGPGGV